MRYFYEPPKRYTTIYGQTYICNHPVYNRATLFLINNKGLCIIQQRYLVKSKKTYWTELDPWLNDELYLQDGFMDYFYKYAKPCKNGLYPTVTIRQIMWALKMKPIKRQPWETVFDKCPI